MNSKLEEMKRVSQERVEKALDTSQAMIVLDSNWKALVGLTKLTSDTQAEILEMQSSLMQRAEMNYLITRIDENSRKVISEQRKVLQDLVSQAGKLNEQFSTQMKQLEESKHKLKVTMWKIVLASYAGLALLQTALHFWLR